MGPDTPGGGGGGGDGLQNHLHDSDAMDELDEMDGGNDDHCYVVNSSGHVSKRRKVDPLTVCSTTGGAGGRGVGGNGGGVGLGGTSSTRRLLQQPDVLEQILDKMVRVHRDATAVQERHFNRIEKVMKDYAAQTKRLADVMCQLLQNNRADDYGGGKNNNKSTGTNSDFE